MAEAPFQINRTLTQKFREKAGADYPGVQIGGLYADSMYHTDFRVRWNGEPKIIRFYKHLSPSDRIDVKTRNITTEERIIGDLHKAGVYTTLRDKTGCVIPNILHVGPREGAEVKFWEAPITHRLQRGANYNYIGFQISDHIPGTPLSRLTDERKDKRFLKEIGTQVGKILAEFHNAAREVDLPRYETVERLSTYDHGYRYAVKKTGEAIQDEKIDKNYRGLAQLLHDDLAPQFAVPGKRETRVHGNMAMEMWSIVPAEKKVAGLVNFTYARLGFPETDFRGLVLFPKALDASIKAYEERAKELTGREVRIDKALALKLALAIHVNSVYLPQHMRTAPLDSADPKGGQKAQEIVASSIVLNQLAKLDERYAPYAQAVRSDAAHFKARYPGIESTIM